MVNFHQGLLVCKAVIVTLLMTVAAVAGSPRVQSMPVASTTLYPGDSIDPAKLIERRFSVPRNVEANFVVDRSQVNGRVARRTIAAGRPIPLTAMRAILVARQGQPAMALLSDSGVEIRTTLLPLQSGEAGQIIQARNPDTGVSVQVRVQADGTLAVLAP